MHACHTVGMGESYADQIARLGRKRQKLMEQLAAVETEIKTVIPGARDVDRLSQDAIGALVGLRRLAVGKWEATGRALLAERRTSADAGESTSDH